MRHNRALALCVWGLAALSPRAMAEVKTTTALVRGTVFLSAGRMVEDASVVIADGRIIAAGHGIPIPDDAEVLDASGLYIYPGFIDCNTHQGISRSEPGDNERARVEDENPDVRQGPQSATVQAHRRLIHPGWAAEELFDPGSSSPPAEAPAPRRFGGGAGAMAGTGPAPSRAGVREEYRQHGFTAALVSPKPAIFSGTSSVIAMGDAPLRRSILRAGFAQHSAFTTGIAPGDFAGLFDRPRYPTTIMGAMAAFRQALLDAGWHRELTAWSIRHPGEAGPPLDRDLEALLEVLDGAKPVVFLANTENEIHRALDMSAEFGLKPILAGAREGWKVADRLKKEKVPLILSLKWSEEPQDKKPPQPENGKPGGGRVATTTRAAAGRRAATTSAPATSAPATRPTTTSAPATQPALPKPSPRRKPVFDEEWESQPFEPARVREERRRLWGEEVDNAKSLAAAGVRFAIGSFEMKSPSEMMRNLRLAVERGLPEEAALASLTHDAAEVLGLKDRIGEIARGKLANLTVLTRPLADKKAAVQWLFVEGKRFDIDEEGRGGRRGRRPDNGEEEAEPPPGPRAVPVASTQAASGPSSQPATQPTTRPAEEPVFASEIEADRRPRLSTGGSVLLRNAHLLTVSGEELERTDLLVRDGKIEAVGRGLAAPAGVRAIDLEGYFITPGLIDPHSHICSDGGLNEFSLSVTCEVRVGDVVDSRDVAAWRALAGGVTTIHTMHGSANTIGGQNAVLRLKYGRPAAEWIFREAPQTVKFALGENVKQSNTDRRTRGTRFPNTRSGVEGVIRRSFDVARDHLSELERFKEQKEGGDDPRPVRRDLRLEALSAVLEGRIWVHSHCYRADEILRLLAVGEEYGFRIGVLQHVLEGYRLIPEMRRHGCGASTFSDWWAYKLEAYDAIPFNAARMTQGGVVATVNSDSPEVMRHLNLEAAKAMRFGGLSPADALRLCTLNGAIQLGVDKWVGSLEPGKRADLAVFDAHPLDTFSRCVLTLIDGEVYFQHGDLEPAVAGPATTLPAATQTATTNAASTRPAIIPRAARAFPGARPPLSIDASPRGEYLLTGGTVFPVAGPPIEDGAVLISEGKIAAAGPRAKVPAPPGVTIVDCRGLQVYPGLINAATSLGLTEIGSVAGSIDTAEIADFQPDLAALSAYNPFAAAIEVARAEGITSALVVQAGGVVSARAGLVRLDGWSMPEAAMEPSVALPVQLPSLPVNFPADMTEEARAETKKAHRRRMAEIEGFFARAKHYAKLVELAGERPGLLPTRDRQLEAMIPFVTGKAPVLMSAGGYKSIREALAFSERYGLRPILLGATEAWKLADELARKKVDVIIQRATAYPAGAFEPWDSVYRNAAVLHAAGVRFCMAAGDASLAKQLGVEAGLAVAHGLEEAAALRSITLDAAAILGVADRLGSLEEGKVADVIITTDTPLQAASTVVGEFIAGRPVTLGSRHSRLDDQFRSRPGPRLAAEPILRGPPAMRVPVQSPP